MSKRTTKYIKALEQSEAQDFEHQSSDQLYEHLQEKGYYWDSNCQNWVFSPAEKNDPASSSVKIRVHFEKTQANDIANKVAELLESGGFKLLDKSKPYICKPPQSNDAMVYLNFSL